MEGYPLFGRPLTIDIVLSVLFLLLHGLFVHLIPFDNMRPGLCISTFSPFSCWLPFLLLLSFLLCVCVWQRVEEEEKAEEAAGARITKKKKTKGKQQGRQAKLTGGATDSGNSFKETRPSPFAEVVDPVIPEFSTEKKTAGKGRGRPKAEPKSAAGEGATAGKDDPKQNKLNFESSDKDKEEVGGGERAKKAPAEKPSQAKKRKVKEIVDSFIISSSSEEEKEEEVEKKSLRERIKLRKTKTTDYKENLLSGEEESEGEVNRKDSLQSGDSEIDVEAPPIKKAKLAAGGSKTAAETGDGAKSDVTSSKTTETKGVGKSNKPKPDGGAEPSKGVGRGKKDPARGKTATAKPAAKPSTKAGAGKTTSGSSGSSGEKRKRGKTTQGKKRVAFVSDEESDYSINSGSGSDSLPLPARKTAAEVCVG